MRKLIPAVSLLIFAPFCAAAQKPATSPANEPRAVRTVRSVNSMGADFNVPLCPASFHDSLSTNGIAGAHEAGVTAPRTKKAYPAKMTQAAVAGSMKMHTGNYLVIVNVVVSRKGVPGDLCLQKSSGYGLDASAATAVEQYRFDPATKDGKPVRMRVPVEVRFVTPTPTPMGTPGMPPR